MDEVVTTRESVPAEADPAAAELWRWMGRRDAFNLVAGRCSTADVESLSRIKEGRLFEKANCSWDEFCARHLHMSRRKVDQEIGYLKQFGPAFFTLRQLNRISVREYAQIAGHVSKEGVHVDGEVVALLPENSERLAGALDTLLERAEPAVPEPPAFDTVLHRYRTATQGLRSLDGDLDGEQLRALAGEIAEAISAAGDRGLVLER